MSDHLRQERVAGHYSDDGLTESLLAAVGPVQLDAAGAATPHLAAYRAAFLDAVDFAFIGALIALSAPDRDAATMRPRPARDIPREPAVWGAY